MKNEMHLFFMVHFILTQFAFLQKISYFCNSQAEPSIVKSRFFCIFKAFPNRFSPYLCYQFPVLQFKIQVFELKFQYRLFTWQ